MQANNSGYRNIEETYKIEYTISEGSFSSIKMVNLRATGEKFTVKVMSKKKMSDEDKYRMLTEIKV